MALSAITGSRVSKLASKNAKETMSILEKIKDWFDHGKRQNALESLRNIYYNKDTPINEKIKKIQRNTCRHW